MPKFKFTAIFGLKPGIDPDETYRNWREDHAIYAKNLTLPEVKRYNINKVIHRLGNIPKEDIWGIAEFWFDDLEAAQKAVGRIQAAPPDEPHVKRITPAKRFIAQEEEVERLTDETSMIKLVSIYGLEPSVNPDEAYRAWRRKHTSWVKDRVLPEAKRYTINRLIHKYPPAGGTSVEFDIFGYEMLWFNNLESALKTARRMQDDRSDEFLVNFIKTNGTVIVEEENIELQR